MNLKRLVMFLATILLLVAVTSQAQSSRPKVPFIQHDICPFECCQYGNWTARSVLKAFKNESDDSTAFFAIQLGESFTAIGGNVHVLEPGVIIIDKSFDTFKKGDEVYVLSYRGEGKYDLWLNGNELRNTEEVRKHGILKQLPEFTWWVSIINKDGQKGWLRFKNISENGFQTEDKVDGRDSCS